MNRLFPYFCIAGLLGLLACSEGKMLETEITQTVEREFEVQPSMVNSPFRRTVMFDLGQEEYAEYNEGIQGFTINKIEFKINESLVNSKVPLVVDSLNLRIGEAINDLRGLFSKQEGASFIPRLTTGVITSGLTVLLYERNTNKGTLRDNSVGIQQLNAWMNTSRPFLMALDGKISGDRLNEPVSAKILMEVTARVEIE